MVGRVGTVRGVTKGALIVALYVPDVSLSSTSRYDSSVSIVTERPRYLFRVREPTDILCSEKRPDRLWAQTVGAEGSLLASKASDACSSVSERAELYTRSCIHLHWPSQPFSLCLYPHCAMHSSVLCHRFLIAKTFIDPRTVHVVFVIRKEALVRGFPQVLPICRFVYFSTLTVQSAVPHRQSPPTQVFKNQHCVPSA